jgi:TolA-binding protein
MTLSSTEVGEVPPVQGIEMSIEEEVKDIKKEIVESRGLAIRTNNLVNSLGADIKSIAKRQAGYERRFTLNSAVAYIIFTVLIFVGLNLTYLAQKARLKSEKQKVQESLVQVRGELEDMKKVERVRERAAQQIQEFYQMVHDHRKEEAIAAYPEALEYPLTDIERAFFKDEVDTMRAELSLEKFQEGLGKAQSKKWKEAEDLYREAIELKEDATHIQRVRLELAIAMRMQGRQKEAIAELSDLRGETLDREVADDVMYQLGVCYAEVHMVDEAKKTLKGMINKFPTSQWVRPAREVLQEIRPVWTP